MHPIDQLTKTLDTVDFNSDCAFFKPSDLRSVLPELSAEAFKALLSHAAKRNTLKRICRGLYIYPSKYQSTGLGLYHAASRLRAHQFNYISLETVLSDSAVISQVLPNWITIMSSGRSQIIECNDLGHIEFIHTKKKPTALASKLTYDRKCHFWRADIALAIKDMKNTKRNLDLVDWNLVKELT